ncbi:hypothetical protein Aduo_001045 [Ancylostoma duodenale]
MGSPALETMSPTNSLVRRVRKADAVGRPGYVLLLPVVVRTNPFKASFGYRAHILPSGIYVSTTTEIPKPYLYISRNIASGLAYLYFFSTLIGLMALRAVDSVWQRDGVSPLFFVNPALFLLPFLFNVLSLGGALLLWTIKSGRVQVYLIKHVSTDGSSTLVIIDAIRFTFLPCLLLWLIYSYFFYGCVLGFAYAYRRAQQWRAQKNGVAAASLSWSFRDRPSLLHKSTEHCVKPSFLSRLSSTNRSWRSYKSTDNPTLRGYVKKSDDEGCPSLLSEEINLSFGSESGSENNNLSRSFCAFNMSRRQLDTVHEEAESQESTLVSSTATDPSKIATRM